MVEFVFPSKRHGWVHGIRGTVVGAKTWSETHISSSGGGGYLHPQHGGYVSGPTIQSRVVQKGEIWIRSAGGRDVKVPELFDAIQGHEVAILWGNFQGVENGPYLYWRNFSAQQHGLFNRNIRLKLLRRPEDFKKQLLIVSGSIVAGAVIGGIFGSGGGLFLGAFMGFFVGLIAAKSGFPRTERVQQLLSDFRNITDRTDLLLNG